MDSWQRNYLSWGMEGYFFGGRGEGGRERGITLINERQPSPYTLFEFINSQHGQQKSLTKSDINFYGRGSQRKDMGTT